MVLMIEWDIQGTSRITMICRVGSRGHGQRDMQVGVFRRSKLLET